MKRAKPKPVVVRTGPQLLTGPPRTPMNPKHKASAPPLDKNTKVRLPSLKPSKKGEIL